MKSYSCCPSTENTLALLGSRELCQRYENIIRLLSEFYEYSYGAAWGGTDFEYEAQLLGALDGLCREIQDLEH